MAYLLPQFNIEVGIEHLLPGGGRSARMYVMGQLKGMPRPTAASAPTGPFNAMMVHILKLPKWTDVRASLQASTADWVYLPGWVGAPCWVCNVYDVAVGFPNEYRCAALALGQGEAAGQYARLPGQGLIPGL